jgi:hypothetical protein
MSGNTNEDRAATERQTMRPLPKEPVEILRYALSELARTTCPEAPSVVHLRRDLIEGITFLEAETAS